MFFGGRQKKIQGLLDSTNAHAANGNFAEVRKAAEEAFKLCTEAFGENVTSALQAQSLIVHAAIKVGDWAAAQAMLERTYELFEAKTGYSSNDTISVRRSLLSMYERRENHAAVLGLVQKSLARFSTEHPEHSILRALSAPGLAALKRVDEAIETAKKAVEDAAKQFAKDSDACAITSMQLATVLIETGRDPATGFNLVEMYRFKAPPRTVPELVLFLRDSHLQAQAHFQANNLNEAAHYLELTLRAAFKPVWEVGGYPRLLYGKLEALHAQALAALGQPEEAEKKIRGAIREVENAAGPRSPDLIPMLEAWACVLRTKEDARNAETQEKRAAAIRTLVTGKKVAPVKQEPRRATNAIWPNRTFAGVIHLRNASSTIVASIIASMRPVSPDDTGFETIPLPGDQAFIVINGWDKVWRPPIALVAKHSFGALANIVRLINTGVVAAGGKPIEAEPWVTVRGDLPCAWEQWPAGQKEKLLREVFPSLPDWRGDETSHRWLGDGIRLENGRPRYISPQASVAFMPSKTLHFEAMGPAGLLDRWFLAFARATQLFAPETYSRLSAGAAEPLIEKSPVARA